MPFLIFAFWCAGLQVIDMMCVHGKHTRKEKDAFTVVRGGDTLWQNWKKLFFLKFVKRRIKKPQYFSNRWKMWSWNRRDFPVRCPVVSRDSMWFNISLSSHVKLRTSKWSCFTCVSSWELTFCKLFSVLLSCDCRELQRFRTVAVLHASWTYFIINNFNNSFKQVLRIIGLNLVVALLLLIN